MELNAARTEPWILRARIVLLTLMATIVAVAAGDVFDRIVAELVVVPVALGVTALVVTRRSWPLRLTVMGVVAVASVAVTTLVAGGTVSDSLAAVSGGPRRLLSTDWPSPVRPDIVATVAFALAVAVGLAVELARFRRLHLLPLLPVVVAQMLVVAFSAPAGVRLGWLLPLGVLALVVAVVRPGAGLRERWTLILGERVVVPAAVAAVGLAALLAVPLALPVRADPRTDEPPAGSQSLIDPIEATLALAAIDPPVPLLSIEVDTDDVPRRWRTAALSEFDGQRWEPALTLRPIGRRLAPSGPDDVTGAVTFLDDDLQLVPLPGAAVTVDARIETDPDRTLVRLVDRPDPGRSVPVRSRRAPDGASVAVGPVSAREVDESVSGLTEFATSIIEDAARRDDVPTDVLGRLRLLETAMREDFDLDQDAIGGGLQRALIVRFIRDTRRGNSEQFATAFVLLARSLGADARIATGFDLDAVDLDPVVEGDSSEFVVPSDSAAVWPEVEIDGAWVAFDPVPAEEASDRTPEPQETQMQTPAAPQPPVAPPQENPEDSDLVEEVEDTGGNQTPSAVIIGLRVAATAAVLLIPVLLVVAAIIGSKWRRRRRRLAGAPAARIRGAWSEATNRLVDAGLDISESSTNAEIASEGSPLAPNAERELSRLATLASAATFGAPARPDLLADDARACLRRIEEEMRSQRSWWQRARWDLSLRSLRRSTRSPV